MALTAQNVVDRIREKSGVEWKTSGTDAFQAGRPDEAVTGIATTFAASLEVLRKAATSGKNMVICRETPFWDRTAAPGAGRGGRGGLSKDALGKNPTYRFKQQFIADHRLTLWRFSDNWDARKQDGQLIGLAKALGWQKHYRQAGGEAWSKGSGYFAVPPASLKATAVSIKRSLGMKSMRIVGDPETRVGKAVLAPGFCLVPDLEKILADPAVDLVVIGEPVEWEASPYFADIVASGQRKGLIVLGNEVSQEPGSGEVADWIRTFITEVPVAWIPAGEPTWMPS